MLGLFKSGKNRKIYVLMRPFWKMAAIVVLFGQVYLIVTSVIGFLPQKMYV